MSDAVRYVGAAALTAVGVVTGNGYLVASGIALAVGPEVVGALIDIPQVPTTADRPSAGQAYNLDRASNRRRLNETMPVLYGRFRIYPEYVTEPWVQYVDNEQYLHVGLALTAGECAVLETFIGDTPISSYQEVEAWTYLPGEEVLPFHTNVSTNEQVTNVEVRGAGYTTGERAFDYSGSTVTESLGQPAFSGFSAGQTVVVTGSRDNDGSYTLASVAPDFRSATITGSFVDETALHEPLPDVFETTYSTLSEPAEASFVGPFPAHPAGSRIDEFAVDIEFPRGLYASSNGGLQSASVEITVQWRQVGDIDWETAGVEELTAASLTPQRFTCSYFIADTVTGRVEVRLRRAGAVSTNANLIDEALWTGLRGFIRTVTVAVPGPGKSYRISNGGSVFGDRTTYWLRIRASGQLNGSAAQKINVIAQRLLPTWDGMAWSDPEETRSIAWAFADAAGNPMYGVYRTYDRIDLAQLLALDAVWAAAEHEFNGYFDSELSAIEALKSIARCGRAAVVDDGRQISLVRDQAQTLRACAFGDRNVVQDSLQVAFDLPGRDTPTGVQVEYHDPVSFQVKTVLAGDDTRPATIKLLGCTSRQHAWEEASFIFADQRLRRVRVSLQTELDGFIPGFGALVEVQSRWPQWGAGGDVLAVAGDERTLTLSEVMDWSLPGPYSLRLVQADGSPADPIACVRGEADDVAVLASDAPAWVYTGDARERTRFAWASSTTVPMLALVRRAQASGEMGCSLELVLENNAVHADPGPAPAET